MMVPTTLISSYPLNLMKVKVCLGGAKLLTESIVKPSLYLLDKNEVANKKIWQFFFRFTGIASLGVRSTVVAIRSIEAYKEYKKQKPFKKHIYAIGIEILAGITSCLLRSKGSVVVLFDGGLLSRDLFALKTATEKLNQQQKLMNIQFRAPKNKKEALSYFELPEGHKKNKKEINRSYTKLRSHIKIRQSKAQSDAVQAMYNLILANVKKAYDMAINACPNQV